MTTHHLKTWPVFFDGLVDGTKTAEVRFRDRGFQVGDTLILQEVDPMTGEYTPRLVSRVVSRVDSLGLLSDDFRDYVLLSFRDREEAEAATAPTKAERLAAAKEELHAAELAWKVANRAWIAADRKVRAIEAEP